MSSGSGWIKLHRALWDNWIAQTPDHLAGWVTILAHVNWRPAKCVIKGRVFHVEPGESLLSYESWAAKLGWTKSRFVRFAKLLEKSECVRITNETVTVRLTVVNWAAYQDEQVESETGSERYPERLRNGCETVAKSIQEGKKIRMEEGEGEEVADNETETEKQPLPSTAHTFGQLTALMRLDAHEVPGVRALWEANPEIAWRAVLACKRERAEKGLPTAVCKSDWYETYNRMAMNARRTT